MLHIVGNAGDQRWRSKAVDLAGGESGDGMKETVANIAPKSHAGPRTSPGSGDTEDGLYQRERQHHGANLHDVIGIGLEDALVDEHGVEGRQRHGGGNRHDLKDQHRPQQLFVWQQIAAHEPVHSNTPLYRCYGRGRDHTAFATN